MCAAFSAAVRCWIAPPARLETPPAKPSAWAPPSACSCAKAATLASKLDSWCACCALRMRYWEAGKSTNGKRGKACSSGFRYEHLAAFAPCAIEHDQTQLRQLSGLHPQRRQGRGARAVAAADRGHWVDTAKHCAYRRQPTTAPAGPGQSTPPLRVGCLAGTNAAAGRCFWRGRAPRGAARSATQHHKPPAAPRDKSNGCKGAGNGGN